MDGPGWELFGPDNFQFSLREIAKLDQGKTPDVPPGWVRISTILYLLEAPLSNIVKIEFPAVEYQLKAITRDNNLILNQIMRDTNTLIRIRLPLYEDEMIRIFIFGSLENVHSAKGELVNFMPIDIIFDIDRNYLDTKMLIGIAFNNGLALGAYYRNKKVLRITLRGDEANRDTIYRVYEEVQKMQAKDECLDRYIQMVRHALVLNEFGIFNDLDLESGVPSKELVNAFYIDETTKFRIQRETAPVPKEQPPLIHMFTSQAYHDVLCDEGWWIMPRVRDEQVHAPPRFQLCEFTDFSNYIKSHRYF